MSTTPSTITVSNEVFAGLEARAHEQGFPGVDSFLKALAEEGKKTKAGGLPPADGDMRQASGF